MRKPSPTTLAAAIALALFAGSAFAQAGRPAAPRATTGVFTTSPASQANVSGSSSSAQGIAQGVNLTQGSNPTVVSTSQGTVVIGTPFASANASQGQTSGASGNAATGTTFQGAQLVDPSGRPITDANGRGLTLDGRGLVGVAPGLIGVAPGSGTSGDSGIVTGTPENANSAVAQVMILNPNDLSAGSVTSTPELDRATRKELAKAKLASRSRNKQLLYTIAPRTNADRSGEVADDPVSPALATPERPIPRY